MLFAVRDLLIDDWCLLFVLRCFCLVDVVWCLVLGGRRGVFVGCCVLAVRGLLVVVCCLLIVGCLLVRCSLLVVGCWLVVGC